MRRRPACIGARLAAALALLILPAIGAADMCPPPGYDRATLRDLRARHFQLSDADRRVALAHALLACLAEPDSELRDRIAYEAYAYWRQQKALDGATWRDLEAALLTRLRAPDDASGVARPFAALVLAEAVHADRERPFLDAAARAALLEAAVAYYTSVDDYRGFDETVGWRHGVAHAADLLGELALEPTFGRAERTRILAALSAQIVARGNHVYVFGESERIAAAVVRAAVRVPVAQWNAWLAAVSAPAPLAQWADAWDSASGLARRQNTMNFLLALYAELALSTEPKRRALATGVGAAMQALR